MERSAAGARVYRSARRTVMVMPVSSTSTTTALPFPFAFGSRSLRARTTTESREYLRALSIKLSNKRRKSAGSPR
jgi:hypothetical protein